VTEEEAQAWLRDRLGVSRETLARLDSLRELVIAQNARQNLVSAASIPRFWARHIADSAQLLLQAPDNHGAWLDLGTGAGFPGIVIAILREAPIHLVESRRLRHEFLQSVCDSLGLSHAKVHGCRLESLRLAPVSVITARAFAPLPKLFELAHSFSTEETLWLLPKGRSVQEELASVRGAWQGVFHVKQSISDPEAAILLASAVRPERKRR
jgi:16S rRNA (guanine527-N7)-methyltransferase